MLLSKKKIDSLGLLRDDLHLGKMGQILDLFPFEFSKKGEKKLLGPD